MSATEPDVFRYEICVRLGDEVRDWQDSRDSGCPQILRLERFVYNQQRKNIGGGQARGVHQPLFLTEPPGLERQETLGKYLLLLSDFLTAEGKAHDSMSPISQRRRMSIAKLLETTAPNGGQDCFEHGCAQSRRCVGSCAHPDHVRNWKREEQEWRGGRCDQSQSKSTRVNRASSRGFPRRQDSPSDDAVFCEKSRNLVNPGKWSNARCDALTTSVLALSCQEPSTCAKRDTETFCLDASGAQHQDQHQIGTKRVQQQ